MPRLLQDKQKTMGNNLKKIFNNTCSICLEEFNNDKIPIIYLRNCKHGFCFYCILEWINVSDTKRNSITCPMCNKDIVPYFDLQAFTTTKYKANKKERMQCPFQDCKSKIFSKNYPRHWKYKHVLHNCIYCKKYLPRHQLKTHTHQRCSLRPIKCPLRYCQQLTTYDIRNKVENTPVIEIKAFILEEDHNCQGFLRCDICEQKPAFLSPEEYGVHNAYFH